MTAAERRPPFRPSRRYSARLALGAVATSAALGSVAACANAATTVLGRVTLPEGGTTSVCGAAQCTVIQGQVAPGSVNGYVLRSPVNGTIVAWSYRSGNATAGDIYALRVLRPASPSETSFTATATSAAPALPDSNDAVRGPYPVDIPIKQGDRIGLQGDGPADFGVPILLTGHNDPTTGDGIRYFAPDIADGTTASPLDPGNAGQQPLVQATIQYTTPPPGCPPTCPPRPRRPALSDLTVTPTDFSPARQGSIFGPARLEPRGSVIRYKLTQDATACFTIEHRTNKPRQTYCAKHTGVWSFARDGHAGTNAFGYRGRIRATTRTTSRVVRLSPGRYTLVAVAENANGRSIQKHTRFNVLP